ncbi:MULTISPECIES: iron-containing alcohol dehydrogenase [Anaerostipes]|uniref:iron-containing alcohol dehydrogenase n=2 Tax=Lachnospiraceae TaxID=186803 RepID=UPI000951C2F7|nr:MULTISPECIES: iron-containing alcohol dehydrogenase [Anaerostipes]MDY2727148.1 iron-containing alcohol dehydrogenase [Anaerostipes faecalis]OLR58351.1 butanol dehydrogenase [Anaerostipes sp. 494a]
MHSFTQYTPTKIVFGKETEKQVGDLALQYGASKVFVVYGGGSVVKSGLLDRVTDALKEAGIDYMTIGGVKPNPRLSFAREAVAKAKDFGTDFVLAVGGGSVIDTSKAVAHGVANPDTDIWEFWSRVKTVEKTIPVGVVLTLAAAGSETSNSAVLTNEETKIKRGLSTDLNRPVFAIMNPELTYTLPKYQIGCGVVDIMMHTLDRYFTKTEHNEMTDEIAEGLLRTVIKNGAIAINDSHDYNAMSEIMWAGSLSHNGLTGLGAVTDFAVHQLGHELSAKFDIAHGASLSAVWGAWATYVYPEKPERFAQYAKRVWGIDTEDPKEAAKEAIAKTVAYFKSLDMPTCFSEAKEIGLKTDEEVHKMAYGCSYEGTRTIGNFKTCDIDDMYEIYKLSNK